MSVKEKVKIIARGVEARERIRNGVDEVVATVAQTLGPHGRNVLIDRGAFEPPRITNDGVFIAKKIKLDNELERVAADAIIEAADQTNNKAGDGTTTAMVLAGAIYGKGFSLLGDTESAEMLGVTNTTKNVMDVYREIQKGAQEAVAELKKAARPAEDNDLVNVATTSLEDEKLGKKIAEIVQAVGEHGFVDVVEGWRGEIEYELVEGMNIRGRFTDTAFIADRSRRETAIDDVPIIITNHTIDNPVHEMRHITEMLSKQGITKAVIMAHGFSVAVRQALMKLYTQHKIMYFPVKIPSLTPEEVEDVAVYCDAKFINKDAGMKLRNVSKDFCGHIHRFVINEDKTVLLGGRGKDHVKERIGILKKERETEKDKMFKLKIDRRIAALASAMAVVHVATDSSAQTGYVKLKIEDAVFSTQSALSEGVVRGGGMALKAVADKLGKEHFLYDALNAPYRQLCKNAGVDDMKVGKNVLDSHKVVRTALENACSVAGTLITADAIIAEKNEYEVTGNGIVRAAEIMSQPQKTEKQDIRHPHEGYTRDR